MAIKPVKLSGSSDGEPIGLTSTTSSGAATIHTCSGSSGANYFEELYLWANNGATGSITCVLEIGDTAAAHTVTATISSKAQPTLLLPGLRLEKGVVVKGWKSTATLTPLNVFGNVNRISS